jgi:hypothetical protein
MRPTTTLMVVIKKSKRIDRLMKYNEQEFDAIIDEAFLTALSRLPTADTRQQATKYLQRDWPKERRRILENLFWALLHYGEFQARH